MYGVMYAFFQDCKVVNFYHSLLHLITRVKKPCRGGSIVYQQVINAVLASTRHGQKRSHNIRLHYD